MVVSLMLWLAPQVTLTVSASTCAPPLLEQRLGAEPSAVVQKYSAWMVYITFPCVTG